MLEAERPYGKSSIDRRHPGKEGGKSRYWAGRQGYEDYSIQVESGIPDVLSHLYGLHG
jgi:hypothetical protein